MNTVAQVIPERKPLEKVAERCADIARTTATRTSTVAILWFAAAVVSWWAIEQDIDDQRQAAWAAKDDLDAARRALNRAVQRIQRQAVPAPMGLDESESGLVDAIVQPEPESTNARKAQEKLDSALLGKIEFRLPAFPSFRVPTRLAPVLLIFIMLLLALYLTVMRARTFRYLSCALRIMRNDLAIPIGDIGQLLGPRTWWMAPLPRTRAADVSEQDFANALGWDTPAEAPRLGTLIFWIALLAIQVRLSVLGMFFVTDFVASVLERVDPNVVGELEIAYVVLVGLTALLACAWLIESRVPSGRHEPHDEIVAARRQFTQQFLTAGVLAVAVNSRVWNGIQKGFTPWLWRVPRFRKRRPLLVADGPEGLLTHSVTGRVFLSRDGHLVGVRGGRVDGLAPMSPGALFRGNAIPGADVVSAVSEFAARALINAGRVDEALRVLIESVKLDLEVKRKKGPYRVPGSRRRKGRRRDRHKQNGNVSSHGSAGTGPALPVVSTRLYDLYVKEAMRLKKYDCVDELIAFIENEKIRDRFESRIRKWRPQVPGGPGGRAA